MLTESIIIILQIANARKRAIALITGIIEQKYSSHFIERIGRFDP